MPKGYIIARAQIHDAEAYARYAAEASLAIAECSGKALVRGGPCEALEGTARSRNVVLEFPSVEAARGYYQSARYQAAKALREGAAELDMVLVEGV